tara:strand:+ start:549 stop:725 length:177 start_codon:yes stop_codon:yes gene_type:complete
MTIEYISWPIILITIIMVAFWCIEGGYEGHREDGSGLEDIIDKDKEKKADSRRDKFYE